MNASVRATLLDVAARLDGVCRDDWWIIGSAAAWLHGARVAPRDVDVLVSVSDADGLRDTPGIAMRAGRAHPQFRSALFGCWPGSHLPVEIMGGFAIQEQGEWRPVHLATRHAVTLGDATLFVPEAGELRALFLRFGRDKDRGRAALL